jgi:uroporphyrinogen III methyltransferase / synthase
MAGKVYLVGAGPGGQRYLTLQAQQLLAQADLVVYDALVDPLLLQLVPSHCICLEAGKRGGSPSTPQTEINHLLVQACQQGQQVVRLKSGDPLVFGRGMAEIEALQAASCAFEVVPGLSSALVAPLLADIPLTHPQLSRCFAVLTAHAPEELEWRALSRLETLVILMAGHQLPEIVLLLQDYGKAAHTPVVVVRWAARPLQQIWRSTLAEIVAVTRGENLSPSVVIVGNVAGLNLGASFASPPASELTTPALPLAGATILVTRAVEQSPDFSQQLRQAGARVLEMPALEIVPPSSWAALDAAIAQLDQFDWLILTSANGVEAFMARLLAAGKDARHLAKLKIAVVGRKTAACLEQRGLQPDFTPPNFIADALVEHFPERAQLAQLKLLFPRVETGGRDKLVRELTDQGAWVVEVAAYESRCPHQLDPQILLALQAKAVDVVTFASSKTVQNFCQLVSQAAGDHWLSWLTNVKIASIGPQTSKTCEQLLGRVDIEASEYTLEGLTQAIISAQQVSKTS